MQTLMRHTLGAIMQRDINNPNKACTQRRLEITQADLPFSCPPQDDRVWDAHPRVYLPIEERGHYLCPYCGTEYVLTDYNGVK